MSPPIKVFIGIRPSLLQIGVFQILRSESNFSVVAESGDKTTIVTRVQQLSPDVLLLNATTHIVDCNQLAVDLKKRYLSLKVLFLASNILSNGGDQSLVATADSVFDIGQDTDLCSAISNISRGEAWFHGQKTAIEFNEISTLFQLTYREKQVLHMVSQGFSNELIAKQMCLAKQTIRNYTSRIYQKISVDSRSEAIVWARENTRTLLKT